MTFAATETNATAQAGRALTRFQVQSTVAAGRLLGAHRRLRTTLESSWRFVPTGGVLPAPALQAGLNILVSVGLAWIEDDWVYPCSGLVAASGATRSDDVLADLISTCEIANSADAALGHPLSDAALLALGRRADQLSAAAIGVLGEREVVRKCQETLANAGRADLAAEVVHVAEISDQLGYDVWSPTIVGAPTRLEVKTTAEGDQLQIHLSRSEYRAANVKAGWALVVCCIVDGKVKVIGWCESDVFEGRLPDDPARNGTWESALVEIGWLELTPGLPLSS